MDSVAEIKMMEHLFSNQTIIDVTKFDFGNNVRKTFGIFGGTSKYTSDGFSKELKIVLEIRTYYTNNLKLASTESCIHACTEDTEKGRCAYWLMYVSRFTGTFVFVNATNMIPQKRTHFKLLDSHPNKRQYDFSSDLDEVLKDFHIWDFTTNPGHGQIIKAIQDKIGFYVEVFLMFWKGEVKYCSKYFWHVYTCGDLDLLLLFHDW